MDDWLPRLAVAVLATWRLSTWLWYESGSTRLRALLWRNSWTGAQVSCFWCVTFWVGLLLAPLALWFWYPLLPLAMSGGAILLSGGGRVIWKEIVSDD